jgi:hypothetical protein
MKWHEVYTQGQKVEQPTNPRQFALRWLARWIPGQIGEGALASDPKETVESLTNAFKEAMKTARGRKGPLPPRGR